MKTEMQALAGLFLTLNCLFADGAAPACKVGIPGFDLRLSAAGEVVGMTFGRQIRAVHARAGLEGCQTDGPVSAKELRGGGAEFSRALTNADGRPVRLTERFTPAAHSVRWEVEIQSDGPAWSAPVITTLTWPDPAGAAVWAAWQDPVDPQTHADLADGNVPWHDPLFARPFAAMSWSFGEPPSYGFWKGNIVTLPLVSILEPDQDLGLSLAQSPEDTLLEMKLTTTSDGQVSWSRACHRLGGGRTVRFAMDLAPHRADWRAAMHWFTARYPAFFEPPNPRVQEMAGTAAYTGEEKPVDVARLNRMAFRTLWKLSDDYAYMGMFLPPLTDPDARWDRTSDEGDPPGYKPQWTSFRRLNNFARYLRQNGFFLLNYFNTTEYGKDLKEVQVTPHEARDPDLWKNPSAYLQARMPNAALRPRWGVWQRGWAVDPGDPDYRSYLLEQAQRHLSMIPDAAGFCIDRTDYLCYYNTNADDGVTWRNGRPARAFVESWRELLNQLGPLVHRNGKVIFCNLQDARLDLVRHVDGVYDELGNQAPMLNGAALVCVHKPLLVWTRDEDTIDDALFQRCLYLGAFPTAPYPHNNHCIQPSPERDRWYLDYGPLLRHLRCKQWVLEPHCIEVVNRSAKANLFRVNGGWVAPVVFGGANREATLIVGPVPGLKKGLRCHVLYPGQSTPAPLPVEWDHAALRIQVPLQRGCALVMLQ